MKVLNMSDFRMRLRFERFMMLLLVIFCTALAQAQDKRTPLEDRYKPQPLQGSEPVPPPNVIVDLKADYRIGVGDQIEIRVEDAPELLTRARVNANGSILMNYLKYVPVVGKTTDELALEVADKLRGGYLKKPLVNVTITQVNSRSFLIQGAVRRPGPLQVEGRPSLFKLIGYAGGLLENYGSRAYVIREIKNPDKTIQPTDGNEPPKYEMLTSNISLLFKGIFTQDIVLEPGDVVNIPPSDVFFVAGEVNAPGQFPLKEGTTLRQAVAMAQNPTAKASPKKAVIFREDLNGERKELPVDISAVMSNKSPDIPLMANDIIIIPDSKLKSTLLPILNGFGSGASFAVGGGIIRR